MRAESGGPLDVSLPGLVGGPFRKHEKEARRGGAHPCFVSSGMNVPTIQADDCVASNAKGSFVPPPPRWPRRASGRRIGAKYTRTAAAAQRRFCRRVVAVGWMRKRGDAERHGGRNPTSFLRTPPEKSDKRAAPERGSSGRDSCYGWLSTQSHTERRESPPLPLRGCCGSSADRRVHLFWFPTSRALRTAPRSWTGLQDGQD